MPETRYTSIYTGQQVESAITKALSLKTFEFKQISDEVIGGIVFHVLWLDIPTENNQVKGFTIHPNTGRLYEVYSNAKTYTIHSYLTDTDVITTSDIDALLN